MSDDTWLGIDPGPRDCGYVLLRGNTVVGAGIAPPDELADALRNRTTCGLIVDAVACERITPYGVTGASVAETAEVYGQLREAARVAALPFRGLYRATVKSAICGTAKANDSNVREALLRRWGGDTAIGKKKAPGPLYGIRSHAWAALAVAVAARDGEGR